MKESSFPPNPSGLDNRPRLAPMTLRALSMGLALGIAYLRLKRNLWVTVLAHAYMDTILFVQMYLGG